MGGSGRVRATPLKLKVIANVIFIWIYIVFKAKTLSKILKLAEDI